MRPRIHLCITYGIVVVSFAAQIVVRVHLVVSAGITTVGGAVVDACQRAFAADQDLLTDLLFHAKDVNQLQKCIILLCGRFKALLYSRVNAELCRNGGGADAVKLRLAGNVAVKQLTGRVSHVRDLSLWISVVSELRAVAAACCRALAKIAVRPFKLLAQCGQVSGQFLDGGLVLLAFLFGSTELLAKINLRLRHRFNSLMHLTEALIVGFLALTENAHHAGKPLFSGVIAVLVFLYLLRFKRRSEHGDFCILRTKTHNLCALFSGELQLVGSQACRGIGHCQPHEVRAFRQREVGVHFNTGVDLFAISNHVLHALSGFDLREKVCLTSQRAFVDILSGQSSNIPHRAEHTVRGRGKIVLNIDARAIDCRVIRCRHRMKLGAGDIAAIDRCSGRHDLEFLAGGCLISHVLLLIWLSSRR
nr:MAG TPA: hypothetical protein [Caudoviricetes sp.]